MELKVLGSSSAGNGYLIGDDKTSLIIESGVSLKEVKKAINYKLENVAGCLITHSHSDHSKYLKDYAKASIQCYADEMTFDALNLNPFNNCLHLHRFINDNDEIQYKQFKIMNQFNVLPFKSEHDCPGSVGYLINHKDTGLICFLTDSFYSKWVFPPVTTYIIECNYSEELLQRSVDNGLNEAQAARIRKSHMSLHTCLELLKSNDLSQCSNIVLIHLSNGNSNAAEFQKTIQEATGIITTIADKNVIVDISKYGF